MFKQAASLFLSLLVCLSVAAAYGAQAPRQASTEPDLSALRRYLPHVRWRVTPLPTDTPESAVISPDGKWVAYVYCDRSSSDGTIATSSTYSVKLASLEEGHLQDVTRQRFANVNAFSWSPDSHWLYLYADDELWKLDVRSRHTEKVSLPWNPNDSLPVWAPDGQSYLLTVKPELPLMNLNICRVWSASHKQVFIAPGTNPLWSPDGDKILLDRMYATLDYPRPALWVVRSDGTQPKRLVSYDDLKKHLDSKDDELLSLSSGSWMLNTRFFLVIGAVIRKDHSLYEGLWIVDAGGKLHSLSGFEAAGSADGKHFIIQTASKPACYMLTLE